MELNIDIARPSHYWGDISNYKIFICDLFNGQKEVAAQELDAFNQAGSNASYCFGNAAWSLYHQNPQDVCLLDNQAHWGFLG